MTTPTKTNAKAPTHTVYYLKPKEDSDHADWIKVGVAWEHGDQYGLNLSLTILGQDIPVTIRKNKPKTD